MSKLEQRTRGNTYSPHCFTRKVLDHVFSRWGALVLGALTERKKRYSELRDEIGGISEKMLAQTLRSLERDGLVERHSFPVVPPHVEYRLTPLGRECARRVWSLVDWIETHALNLERAQVAYDQDCAPAVGGSYAGVIPAERNASRAG